jgi:hypothetical protein
MATTVNLDTSERVDITCRRGDTFTLIVTFTDANGAAIDLSSGYQWKMDVKDTDTSASDIIADDSFVYSGNSSGQLTISASAETMADATSGTYVYDLQSSVAGVVKTWIYGIFKINEDVSE